MDIAQHAAIDWQAVGAIATAIAAFGSLAVVVLTARMARSAQATASAASDEAAAAWRPVLLPTEVEAHYDVRRHDVALVVELRNAGQGPALNASLSVAGGRSRDEAPIEILTAGSYVKLHGLKLPADTVEADLTVQYDDLGGQTQKTLASFDFRPPEPHATVRNNPSIAWTRVRRNDEF